MKNREKCVPNTDSKAKESSIINLENINKLFNIDSCNKSSVSNFKDNLPRESDEKILPSHMSKIFSRISLNSLSEEMIKANYFVDPQDLIKEEI